MIQSRSSVFKIYHISAVLVKISKALQIFQKFRQYIVNNRANHCPVSVLIMMDQTMTQACYFYPGYTKLAEAETDIQTGMVSDAMEGLRMLWDKYGL